MVSRCETQTEPSEGDKRKTGENSGNYLNRKKRSASPSCSLFSFASIRKVKRPILTRVSFTDTSLPLLYS